MAELPSGTVTLLFTDIEGSTRLLAELGDGYEQLLVEHRQLLQSAFEETGGHIVDTQGDAFFVAFRRARDAVEAAVAGQRALAEHNWPAGSEPKVRMGIDTGEPSLGEEGFVGLPVHRAARICAAGYGGQVLLSRTTRDLVEDFVPPGTHLVDLGDHRLKDFDRPERISHLAIDGLRASFPPLRTLESHPAATVPFAGSEEQLAAAAQAALSPVPPRPGRWAKWKEAIHGPIRPESFRRSRSAHAIEHLGFRVYSMARIAPRDDLERAVRALGSVIVTGARLVGDADRLIADMDRKELVRRLAEAREAAISERQLRIADALARQIGVLDRLVGARQALDQETRLEHDVAALRDELFEVRTSPERAPDLIPVVDAHRERVQEVLSGLDDAYVRASTELRRPSSARPARERSEDRVLEEERMRREGLTWDPRSLPAHLRPKKHR